MGRKGYRSTGLPICLVVSVIWSGACSRGASESPQPPQSAPASAPSTASPASSPPQTPDPPGRKPEQLVVKAGDGLDVAMSLDEAPPHGHPSDFFPTNAGTKWTYTIDLGEAEPLRYEVTSWPLGTGDGGKSVAFSSRGLFHGAILRERRASQTPLRLEITVKGPAKKQGPFEYPRGVELAVGADDLGVFEGVKTLYWAIGESSRYSAQLVMMRDPDSSGAPGSGSGFGQWGRADGHSFRFFFFVDRPGIQISAGDSPDALLFAGPDAQPASCKDSECLRLVRVVKAAERKADEKPGALDLAFREEMWFARHKGLVHLVQSIGGRMSMRWTLASFTPGRE
jgi:hypothetical protein